MRGPKSERSEGKELEPGRRELGICVDGRNSESQRRPRLSVRRGRVRQSSCANLAQGLGTPGFQFATNDLAFFAQDDWRIRPRLTLSLGLRWDSEFLPSTQIPNSLLPGSSSLPSDRSDFGPRIGAAYQLTRDGKTVIRGGYGIFYGRIINSTIFSAISSTGVPAGQSTVFLLPSQTGAPTYPNVIASGNPPPSLNVVQFAPATKLPMIHEFDLEVEREIATNTA